MLRKLTWLAGLVVCSVGCAESSGSADADSAQQALEESTVASQADALMSDAVEISTHFSVGNAAALAAIELASFIQAQLPCADIQRDGATLSIAYGAQAGDCSYHGHVLSGESSLRIMRNAADEIAVHHEWNDFGDGQVLLNGSADVVWSSTTSRRHITHQITYRVLSGRFAGRSASASGDCMQDALDAGFAVGIRIDGTRSWQDVRGSYELDIDGVEMRWLDPVPQAGIYELTTPSGASFSLTFGRKDADSIQVSARSGTHAFSFVVNADGSIER
jgi:hypothetical protein